jgi:ubiquinone/menaquinone biosynthesis C-methylase UbiE
MEPNQQKVMTGAATFWDAFADWYARAVEPQTTELNNKWLEQVKHFTASRQLRVLELGCGTGMFAQQYMTSKLLIEKVQLFDISQKMLSMATERLSHLKSHIFFDIHLTSDEALAALPNNSVDVVFAQLFFNVVPNPEFYLEVLRRVLRKDGLISISVNSQDSPDSYFGFFDEALERVDKDLAAKLKFTYALGNHEEIQQLLEQHGFKIEHQGSASFKIGWEHNRLEDILLQPMNQTRLNRIPPEMAEKVKQEIQNIIEEDQKKGLVRGLTQHQYICLFK